MVNTDIGHSVVMRPRVVGEEPAGMQLPLMVKAYVSPE